MSHHTPAANPIVVTELDDAASTTGPRSFYIRYFFVAMAVLFPLITALGFVPQLMEIHSRHLHLHWLTHVHGAVMTSWLLVFFVQALLAARGRLKYHRQLGIFSVGIGAIVFLTMISVTLSALIRNNPPEGDDQFDILALSLATIILFAWFFTWGIRNRKDGGTHKRMVFLATLPMLSAGVDRIQWLPMLYSALYVRYLYLDLLLIPLFVYDLLTLRRIHKMTLIGVSCLVASQLIVVRIAPAPAWHRFAYDALTPFVERLPEVTLNAAQSAPLLGVYGSKDWQMTVSREGDRLFLLLPDPVKLELGANSETDLFLYRTKWQLHFVKDADGRVTKVINKQPDPTGIWETPKLK